MHRVNDLTLTALTQEDNFHFWRVTWLIDLIYHRSVANQPRAEWHHCFKIEKDFSAKSENRLFFQVKKGVWGVELAKECIGMMR